MYQTKSQVDMLTSGYRIVDTDHVASHGPSMGDVLIDPVTNNQHVYDGTAWVELAIMDDASVVRATLQDKLQETEARFDRLIAHLRDSEEGQQIWKRFQATEKLSGE